MDETIGVKGGKNDRRRRMIISKQQKKKLTDYEQERKIAELEKDVKKKQIYTLIKTLPIVIGGGTIKTLHDVATGKRVKEQEEKINWRLKEYDQDITHMTPEEFKEKQEKKTRKVIVLPTGEKVIVYVAPVLEENKTIEKPTVKPVTIEKDFTDKTPIEEKKITTPQEIKVPTKKQVPIKKVPKGVSEEVIDVEEFIDNELAPIDIEKLSPQAKRTLDNLKSRKIVEEYEKQLKDIRYELRKVIYEYNVLVDDEEKIILSKDAEIILDKLSDIIKKIEILKAKIRIDNLDKYDDNYIYVLIEGYLRDFKDKKVIEEIKDSPLYVLLEEKLDELEKKRNKLEEKVETKKGELEQKEEDFENLKNRYYSLDKLNNQLLEFQYDQDRLLKEIQEKVANAKSEKERIEVEFQAISAHSRRFLEFLTFSMFLPGPKFARGIAAHTAAYLYFINNVLRPNTKTRKYKVINVIDYHDDIMDNIKSLEDAIRLLGKTTDQIDKMIKEIKDKYSDYLYEIPECRELLSNLEKVKSEMKEKEDEMKRLKKEQEKELEKNDAKVKTIGEYAVN